MPKFEPGDRVRNKIAPEMTGVVVEYSDEAPGWIEFQSDNHGDETFPFHEDSFEKE